MGKVGPVATPLQQKPAGGQYMPKDVLRILLTILMYTGVLIFFIPHLMGRASLTLLFNLAGLLMAVICGLLRCYLTEEST